MQGSLTDKTPAQIALENDGYELIGSFVWGGVFEERYRNEFGDQVSKFTDNDNYIYRNADGSKSETWEFDSEENRFFNITD